MLTIRSDVNGNWKPDNLPDLELDSVRRLTFNLGAAIGAATVSTFAIASDNLTFGSPTVTSPNVTVTLTAGQAGGHVITTSAVLSNSETLKSVLYLNVLDSSGSSVADYN